MDAPARPSAVLARVTAALLFASLATGAETPRSAQRSVNVSFSIRGPYTTTVSGRVVAAPVGSEGDTAVNVERPLPDDLSQGVRLELGGERSWRLIAEAPGFWSAPAVLGPTDREARLELLPTAPLEIRATLPRGAAQPGPLSVEVRPATGEWRFPTAGVACPRREAVWSCDVPAARVDLKLTLDGYVPVYRWGLGLEAGQQHRIDAGALLAGASVSGFVTAAEGDASGAHAHLERHLMIPGGEGREEALALSTAVNERGFFLFAGVAPGEYVVRIDEDAYATARSEMIRVDEGAETHLLTPLYLERPLDLQVFLRPPLDPWSEPWQVEIVREEPASRRFHQAIRRPADATGAWVESGLDPGPYRLRALDSRGSVVTQRDVDVTPTLPPVELDIDVIPLEGVARMGDEPVEGKVMLTGVRGARMHRMGAGFVVEGHGAGRRGPDEPPVFTPDYRTMSFDTDSEGRFEGYLPNEGFWEVEIDAADGAHFRLPEPVEVHRPEGDGPAKIEVEVPDTKVAGRVVDDAGRPVGGAFLVLVDPANGADVGRGESAPDGTFSFRGLSEDPVLIEGEGPEGLGAAIQVEPRSGEGIEVELVLEREVALEGLVSSVNGPLPGVLLELRPVGAGVPTWTTTGTGVDGRFRHGAPKGTTAIDVIVVAPGLPVKLARIPIAPSESRARVEVYVDDLGGTLRLVLGGGASTAAIQVIGGGTSTDLMSLLGAVMASPNLVFDGESLAFSLEPGQYIFCSPGPNCQNVYLSAGGAAEVRLGDEPGSAGGA